MNQNKLKVICLTGPSPHHFSTIASLMKNGVEVIGAVIADSNTNGINLKYLKNAIIKLGFLKVLGQIFERIIYQLFNSKKDKKIYNELFNIKNKNYVQNELHENLILVNNYSESNVIEFIRNKKPDIIIIHTPFWVPKKIRSLVSDNVLGAHPGITQYYRGVHSPFWAIYNNDESNIGYTIFWVNNSVDGGDIIHQGFVNPQKDDSYISLSWRGMKMIPIQMSQIILKANSVSDIKSVKYGDLLDETLFYHPTIFNYIKYRFISKFR